MKTTNTIKIMKQLTALALVLVAVSACSKKDGSRASVRSNRTQHVTQPTGVPGTPTSPHGTIQATQQTVQMFVGAGEGAQLGQVYRVLFQGYVSDGYSRPAGGQVKIMIQDSLGQIDAQFNQCSMQVMGNRVTVNCQDSAGSITFDGTATQYQYTGNVFFDGNNQLGTFSVSTCQFIDAGC